MAEVTLVRDAHFISTVKRMILIAIYAQRHLLKASRKVQNGNKQVNMSKTNTAIEFFMRGEYKHSLRIFKTFKNGFTKSQLRTIEIASDCLNGNDCFYRQIGIDPNVELSNALSIIKERYKLR